jgi:hypothetical protein
MKKSKNNISNWLKEHGDPEICKQVERELEEITLEKAAENYANQKGDIPTTELEDAIFKQGFIDGAKWQTERMYSEEEVEQIAKDAYSMGRKNILISKFNFWVQEFKKK